jgi:hypothetical protein
VGTHDFDTARESVIRLAFAGDPNQFEKFIALLRAVTPPGVDVILRGSAVTGSRWLDDRPFDAEGPGTSDLDVTFVGPAMLEQWESFYIPGLHSRPLSEEHPDAAPVLESLRRRLCALAGRPVNLQASTDLVQSIRNVLFRQPYVILIAK